MNTIQKLLTCLLFGLVFLTYSCNDDDDEPSGCNYANEIQDELNAVIEAGNVWGADNTPANCQAYKNAYQSLINELNDHVECATVSGQKDELEAYIDDLQAELNALQC